MRCCRTRVLAGRKRARPGTAEEAVEFHRAQKAYPSGRRRRRPFSRSARSWPISATAKSPASPSRTPRTTTRNVGDSVRARTPRRARASAVLTPDRVAAPAGAPVFLHFDFRPDGRSSIAFSGGSDSTALLHLSRRLLFAGRGEAGGSSRSPSTTACGAESGATRRDRAGATARRSASRTPDRALGRAQARDSGVQDAARTARYRLLGRRRRRRGAHRPDRAYARRPDRDRGDARARAGEGRGLSGIAPATLYERRTWFVRPLLRSCAAELRALAGGARPWLDRRPFERRPAVRARAGGRIAPAAIRPVMLERPRRPDARRAEAAMPRPGWSPTQRSGSSTRKAGRRNRCCEAGGGGTVSRWRSGRRARLAGRCDPRLRKRVLRQGRAFCAESAPGQRMTVVRMPAGEGGRRVRIGREARNRREAGYGFDHCWRARLSRPHRRSPKGCGRTGLDRVPNHLSVTMIEHDRRRGAPSPWQSLHFTPMFEVEELPWHSGPVQPREKNEPELSQFRAVGDHRTYADRALQHVRQPADVDGEPGCVLLAVPAGCLDRPREVGHDRR